MIQEQKDLVERPYPNEHSCRLKSSDDYSTCRRTTREHEGKEYSVLTCRRKDDSDKWEEQAFRYKKTIWTVSQARSHCKDHDGTFEPAQESNIDNLISTGSELLGKHE